MSKEILNKSKSINDKTNNCRFCTLDRMEQEEAEAKKYDNRHYDLAAADVFKQNLSSYF